MLASIALSYTLDLPGHGIAVLGKSELYGLSLLSLAISWIHFSGYVSQLEQEQTW